MKRWKKTLSVGLSLVMCASLVAPGFAANFTDLQRAINGTDKYATNPFTAEDGSTRYGYGAGEGSSWEIEAWNTENEDGTVTRNVQLNENVIREKGEALKTITIKEKTDVTIDLNGNDIDAKSCGATVIEIKKSGELTLTDSTAKWVEDKEGNLSYESGAITGGFSQNGDSSGGGGVTNYGTLTIEGGAIAGNKSNFSAGGVYNKGTVIMEDGVIADNKCGGVGGGVRNYGTFMMTGGAITGNTSKDGAGGGGVYNEGAFLMRDGTIADNSAGNGGGVYNDEGTFTMEGGSIVGNTTGGVGGAVRDVSGKLIITGGTISGNTAKGQADEIECASTVKLVLPEGSVWDSDSYSDRSKSVPKVYSGEQLSDKGKGSFELKHHEHTFTIKETTPPTCTEDGKVVYSGCICGQDVTETIEALGHDMGKWYVTRYATSDEDGEERSDCQREGCDYFETRPTSVTDPDLEKPDPEDPDPEKPDPEKPDPEEPDPEKPDPEKPDPVNPDPEKPDPEKPDPEKPDPEKPDPEKPDPVNPDPEKPNPVNPDPEKPVEIEDPETPLGELPDEVIDIEDPDTPLAEQPETPDEAVDIDEPDVPLAERPETADETVEIDGPEVPLGDVPQTGEASTVLWLAGLLAAGMGLVYLNTGKRKENA